MRDNMMKMLYVLQNRWFLKQDIVTITGFMDDKEVQKHVMHYFEQLTVPQRVEFWKIHDCK